jgi:2-C-methyl-D-erythritol 4-phosphate cytidylyltransferase
MLCFLYSPFLSYILFARMKVFVIIPAAGLGTRMASAAKEKKPIASKQFADLQGKPILVHTIFKFLKHAAVNSIYVALRKEEIARFRKRLEQESPEILAGNPVFIEGGEHRQASVANALGQFSTSESDIVLVHDAVRPLVTNKIISDVIAAAEKHGAAIAGVPAIDTVKQVERTAEGALIKATVPREKVVMAQTPQGFRYGVLKKAFDEAEADGFLGTDEASLVERSGHRVMVVMGSVRNVKITTPADLELAEFYMQQSALAPD